jgi:hypothetical protein
VLKTAGFIIGLRHCADFKPGNPWRCNFGPAMSGPKPTSVKPKNLSSISYRDGSNMTGKVQNREGQVGL